MIFQNGKKPILTKHAKERLKIRFGLEDLPQSPCHFFLKTVDNKFVFKIHWKKPIYFIMDTNNYEVITVLNRQMVKTFEERICLVRH